RCVFSWQLTRPRSSERSRCCEAIVPKAVRAGPALSLCRSPTRAIFQERVVHALWLCDWRVAERPTLPGRVSFLSEPQKFQAPIGRRLARSLANFGPRLLRLRG